MTIYLTHFCVNVRQGQMCNLQTGQELETILISFYTFGILLDLKNKNQCFKRISGLQSKTQTLPYFESCRFFHVIVKVIKSVVYNSQI